VFCLTALVIRCALDGVLVLLHLPEMVEMFNLFSHETLEPFACFWLSSLFSLDFGFFADTNLSDSSSHFKILINKNKFKV